MIYILIAALLCLIYDFLLFRHLGKKRFHITLGILLIGLACAAPGYFLTDNPLILRACIIAHVVIFFMVICLIRNCEDYMKHRRAGRLATLPERKLKCATETCTLTRKDMLLNFRELSEKDELTSYEPDNNFLAWNDGQGMDIHIHLLPGEDWVGLLYVTSYELRDSEIKAACKKGGVTCPPELLGKAPSGLVTYCGGQLSITPAAQKKYIDELRRTVLAERDVFTAWLPDYIEEV